MTSGTAHLNQFWRGEGTMTTHRCIYTSIYLYIYVGMFDFSLMHTSSTPPLAYLYIHMTNVYNKISNLLYQHTVWAQYNTSHFVYKFTWDTVLVYYLIFYQTFKSVDVWGSQSGTEVGVRLERKSASLPQPTKFIRFVATAPLTTQIHRTAGR